MQSASGPRLECLPLPRCVAPRIPTFWPVACRGALGATFVEIFGAGERRETVDPNKISSLVFPQQHRPFQRSTDRKRRSLRRHSHLEQGPRGHDYICCRYGLRQAPPLGAIHPSGPEVAKPGLELDDPEDPLETLNELALRKGMGLQEYEQAPPKRRRPPRVIDATWLQLMRAHQNDYDQAKKSVDQLLAREAKRLQGFTKDARRVDY